NGVSLGTADLGPFSKARSRAHDRPVVYGVVGLVESVVHGPLPSNICHQLIIRGGTGEVESRQCLGHVGLTPRPSPPLRRTGAARIDMPVEKCLQWVMLLDANTAIDEVYRGDWGRIVATLIRLTGDFDLAEEAVQEAFAAAVHEWRASGVPNSP